ncbi:MAG: GMC family oxidoreductase [Betaproteobacteria bacterium]|nr:GMC family oxidoreductase [Betaproteobacteria bacterium]
MKATYGVGVDWPISYAELEPYYLRAEQEIGVCGDDNVDLGSPRSGPYPLPPMPLTYLDRVITGRLRPHGFKFVARPSARNSVPYDNRLACHGFNSCSPICPTGAQYAAIVHIRKAEALGVRVLEEALVTRVDVDKSGTVRSLTYKRPDGVEHRLTARAYVLAANGIETPRLMLISRSRRVPNGLANSSDQVGRNLMDHPGLSVRFLMPVPIYAGRGPDYTVNFFGFRDGQFRRFQAGWGMSLYNRLHLHDITNELLQDGVVPPELDRQIRFRAGREVEFDTHVELLPNPENRIQLDDKRRDSGGLPLVRINYRIGDYTLRGFEHCRQILRQFAKLLGAARYRDRGVFSHHHLMGTTRMGDDPKASVVDRECRAHDHRNLFIAGSSVFTTGSTANPTLTIAALSLRLAEALKRELGVSA